MLRPRRARRRRRAAGRRRAGRRRFTEGPHLPRHRRARPARPLGGDRRRRRDRRGRPRRGRRHRQPPRGAPAAPRGLHRSSGWRRCASGSRRAGGRAAAFPPADAAYHDYAEMAAEVGATAAAYPSIVQRFSIGTSYQGREIWAVKVSDNVATDEAEPEVLFTANQHAREHLTVEMALYILQRADVQVRDRRADHEHRRQPRDLDRLHGQPGRRRVRHRHRRLPDVAQEPPAQRRLERRRHRPQPQLVLPVGLLRRLVGHAQLGDLPRRRRRSRRPRPSACATS